MRHALIAAVLVACVDAPEAVVAGPPPASCPAAPFVIDADLLANGFTPADTGARQVFDPDTYGGGDAWKLYQASLAAEAVGGAVVMDRIYVIDATWYARPGVMYTGGGFRRACMPVATTTAAASSTDTCVPVDDSSGFFYTYGVWTDGSGPEYSAWLAPYPQSIRTVSEGAPGEVCNVSGAWGIDIPAGAQFSAVFNLVQIYPPYSEGAVFDSVLFDGARDCNGHTHASVVNTMLGLRGGHVVRNSAFVNASSENVVQCGIAMIGNVAQDLNGSFAHASCTPAWRDYFRTDTFINNHLTNVNEAGDAVMGHSEAAWTMSAACPFMALTGNTIIGGGEAVYGWAQPDDFGMLDVGGCYEDVTSRAVLQTSAGTNESLYRSVDVTLINVGPIIEE
jgi:hypothetical protein